MCNSEQSERSLLGNNSGVSTAWSRLRKRSPRASLGSGSAKFRPRASIRRKAAHGSTRKTIFQAPTWSDTGCCVWTRRRWNARLESYWMPARGRSACRRFRSTESDRFHECPSSFPDFLAELTQHIADKCEHLVRYCNWYAHRQRGLRAKLDSEAASDGESNALARAPRNRPRMARVPVRFPRSDGSPRRPFSGKCLTPHPASEMPDHVLQPPGQWIEGPRTLREDEAKNVRRVAVSACEV
jgi:hypothetical protein